MASRKRKKGASERNSKVISPESETGSPYEQLSKLKLPAPVGELIDPKLPEPFAAAARYARGEGLALMLREPSVWGVGAGHDGHGGPAVAYMYDPAKAKAKPPRFPKTVKTFEGLTFPVVTLAVPRLVRPHYGSSAKTKFSGALTGCLVSTDHTQLFLANVDTPGGGTLSGVFPPAFGSGHRAVTNAHVAVGLDAQDLFSKMPQSFPDLFRSPRGARVLAYDDETFPNGGAYELFQVDTPWPIIMPIPFSALNGALGALNFALTGAPLSGALLGTLLSTFAAGPLGPLFSTFSNALGGFPLSNLLGSAPLTFQYIDVAAGPVRPTPWPGGSTSPVPPAPAARRTVRGQNIHPGRPALPGENVYAIGVTSDLRWGSVFAAGVVVQFDLMAIPAAILSALGSILGSSWTPPPVLVFNLNLYIMQIAPGDSGMTVLFSLDHASHGIAGLGLGGTPAHPNNGFTMGTPYHTVDLFGDVFM